VLSEQARFPLPDVSEPQMHTDFSEKYPTIGVVKGKRELRVK
jgi:hypothetical protein